jgi:uncharacterized protein
LPTLSTGSLLNPADKWHQEAKSFSQTRPEITLVTTDAVLMEVLNYFSEAGARMRQAAVALCEQVMEHGNAVVLPQSRETFTLGFNLYKARPDKGYSLTDCISMIAMRDRKLREVLTHDRHFVQEGFELLLR